MLYAFLRQKDVEKKTMTSVQTRATQAQAFDGFFMLSMKVPFNVYSYTKREKYQQKVGYSKSDVQ